MISGLVNAHSTRGNFRYAASANWLSSAIITATDQSSRAYTAEDVRLSNRWAAQPGTGPPPRSWTVATSCRFRDGRAATTVRRMGLRAVVGRARKPPIVEGKRRSTRSRSAREMRRLRTAGFASERAPHPRDGTGRTGRIRRRGSRIRRAREYGLINSAHTYGRKGKPTRVRYARLEEGDRARSQLAHGNCFDDEELKIVLDAGCTITATCFTEALNYEQPAMLGRLVKHGATPSIGTDCDPYFNSSMLWTMRHAFQSQRELDNRSLFAAGQYPAKTQHSTHTRDALYWATMGAQKRSARPGSARLRPARGRPRDIIDSMTRSSRAVGIRARGPL